MGHRFEHWSDAIVCKSKPGSYIRAACLTAKGTVFVKRLCAYRVTYAASCDLGELLPYGQACAATIKPTFVLFVQT